MKISIYHNDESRFTPYQDGHQLVAVTSHWLPWPPGSDPQTLADWAFHAFNADLDLLQAGRGSAGGETTFLAACVYRLLGYRSLSVGDVVQVAADNAETWWLAFEPFGWRPITTPTNLSGQPLSAATVYQHLATHTR